MTLVVGTIIDVVYSPSTCNDPRYGQSWVKVYQLEISTHDFSHGARNNNSIEPF